MRTISEWERDSLHSRLSSLKRHDELNEIHKRDRKIDWSLFPLAVVGIVTLIYYCTFSMPVEHWPIGLLGIILTLPWLTRRFN